MRTFVSCLLRSTPLLTQSILFLPQNLKYKMKLSKPPSFYFASRSNNKYYQSGDDDYQYFLRRGDGFIDKLPSGSTPEQFESRRVGVPPPNNESCESSSFVHDQHNRKKVSKDDDEDEGDPLIGSHLVERKVQIKVEPKVIFAAERTFFTWLRSALFLFGASMTVMKYSQDDPVKLLYGALLLPLTLVFIIYPLMRYRSRIQMLRRKAPGPYYDVIGPTILCILVMIAIVCQFCLRLSYFWYTA